MTGVTGILVFKSGIISLHTKCIAAQQAYFIKAESNLTINVNRIMGRKRRSRGRSAFLLHVLGL